MFWSWLFPPRRKMPESPPDPGEGSIPPLSVGPVGDTPAAPIATPATTSIPTDAGAAAAVGAAFLLGAEMVLHGQAQAPTHDPGVSGDPAGDASNATHAGLHSGSHGNAGTGDGGPADGS